MVRAGLSQTWCRVINLGVPNKQRFRYDDSTRSIWYIAFASNAAKLQGKLLAEKEHPVIKVNK